MAHIGGANNLDALTGYWSLLKEEEQTPELRAELVKVVAQNGGPSNLEALTRYWSTLKEAEQTPELRAELVRVVAHDSGSQNLKVFEDYWGKLPAVEQSYDFKVSLAKLIGYYRARIKHLNTLTHCWQLLLAEDRTVENRLALVQVIGENRVGSNILQGICVCDERFPAQRVRIVDYLKQFLRSSRYGKQEMIKFSKKMISLAQELCFENAPVAIKNQLAQGNDSISGEVAGVAANADLAEQDEGSAADEVVNPEVCHLQPTDNFLVEMLGDNWVTDFEQAMRDELDCSVEDMLKDLSSMESGESLSVATNSAGFFSHGVGSAACGFQEEGDSTPCSPPK